MANIFKVDDGENRTIIYADTIAQVKLWCLAQHDIQINTATPRDVFEFYQKGGEPFILTHRKDEEEVEEDNQESA